MRKIAVDTNILSRLLADTSSEEGRYAEQLLASSTLFVSKTVLLETEWLLRSVLKINRDDINRMISAMLTLDIVEVEDVEQVATALHAHSLGMDFADALHVLGSGKADCFVTFDRDLVKYAKRHIDSVNVELAQ